MELTGRLTADAQVSTLTDSRVVTNFTIVINDRFTTKSGEKRDVPTYVKCAYWMSAKVAAYLKKGAIVSLYGRIGMDVYRNSEGEPKGSLTFHVNDITFVAKPAAQAETATPAAASSNTETVDDLPF